MSDVETTTVTVREAEVAGGLRLRVALVSPLDAHGGGVVLEKAHDSDGPFELLRPGDSERVHLREDDLPVLKRMIEGAITECAG